MIPKLKDYERRTTTDPYCPVWCPYQCTGYWKTGQCLIRLSWVNRELKNQECVQALGVMVVS